MKTIRNTILAVLLVGAIGIMAVGCGSGSSDDDSGKGIVREAASIQDGAEKYDNMQMECPVCGGKPIEGEFYAEVDGKRIYFDNESCMTKFKEDPQKYLKDYKTYEEKMKESMMQSR